jgi:hypothetical protein
VLPEVPLAPEPAGSPLPSLPEAPVPAWLALPAFALAAPPALAALPAAPSLGLCAPDELSAGAPSCGAPLGPGAGGPLLKLPACGEPPEWSIGSVIAPLQPSRSTSATPILRIAIESTRTLASPLRRNVRVEIG